MRRRGRNSAQDAQKGRPFRPSFVERRSYLVAEPAPACSRDTLHNSRFTGVEDAAGGLFPHPARKEGNLTQDRALIDIPASHFKIRLKDRRPPKMEGA